MAGSEQYEPSTPHSETHTRACHPISTHTHAALPACCDANTHVAIAVAPQDLEPKWSEGGDILTDTRGRSRPPRHLVVQTPGRGAKEK